jgi:selenide,water dikinase
LSAYLKYENVPKISCLQEYIDQGSMPGATRTNWKSVQDKVKLSDESWRSILCDPQTSGGLLIAVEESSVEELEEVFKQAGIFEVSIGHLSKEAVIGITVA